MLGHVDCCARIELPLLTPTHSQGSNATLHVMLQSQRTSFRVALDVWDFSPRMGLHE